MTDVNVLGSLFIIAALASIAYVVIHLWIIDHD